MQLVGGVHHSVEQLAVPIRQFVVDVEIPQSLAIGKLGEISIDLVDRRHHRSLLPSASLARLALILSIVGITAMLSLRGKMPVTTMVAPGAFVCMTRRIACRPRVMSATLPSSPPAGARLPTLLVPASRTTILGLTPSSSPLSRRQR